MAQTTGTPRVSVLMTTHNGAPFVRESIGSILSQTMRDLELVLVDDASTDGITPALAEELARSDPRLRLIRAERNLGVVGARNLGIASCRGTYLAALDHDDLSAPERLALQSAFLDRQPNVVLVGSQVRLSWPDRTEVTKVPGGHAPELARWMLHIDNPLTWSSVMMRLDAVRRLDIFVRPEVEYADDFDLYHRLLPYGDVAWLDEVLTTYRIHGTNTFQKRAQALLRNASAVLAGAYRPWLGERAEAAATLVVSHVSHRMPIVDAATLGRLGEALSEVLAHYCDHYRPSAEGRVAIQAHAAETWWRVVRSAARGGHPLLLSGFRRHPSLLAGYRPGLGDMALSGAIGVGRAVARGLGLRAA